MRRLAVLLLALVLVSPQPALAADNPQATLFSPSAGVSVPLNEPLLVIGGAFNGEAGGITEVEISTDDGASWTSTDAHTEKWAIVLTPAVPGPLTIQARAHTASATGPITVSRTVHVGGTTTPPVSGDTPFFLQATPDPVINDPDDQAVELGIRTTVDRPGALTGVILRRGSYTGPVTARVWSPDGTLLLEQAAPGAAFSQRITFSTPVPVQAGTEYVVSYLTPSGGYAATENYFVGGLAQAPFYAPLNAGVYRYGGGFPTDTWNASNYWVQPIFRP
ncbi:DUF4082 domain-containing protein [Lentzea sp. NPDC051213]|uniref:DUF4082 domain-containing protein n=1 Tax=Lentzea sp. NPDC051213 TaxID=3364126 RepID=UPI0037AF6439